MPAYYGGGLKAHNHTTTAGDGGQLNNPSVSGNITVSSDADTALELVTFQQAQVWGLLNS
jgi:hypothetical protein